MKLKDLTYNKSDYIDRKISTQPELMIAFLQSKMTHVGRLWLALKFLDYQLAGILPLNYTKEVLCNKESDHYLMSYGNLLKLLHKFNGEFWVFANDRIVIKSPAKIANYYNLPKFGYDSVWIYPDQLFSGLAIFNATCYAGYITTLGDMPTSRETIKEDTGIGKTSQIRYEAILGIELQPNVVLSDGIIFRQNEAELKKEWGNRLTKVTIDEFVFLAKRIGNSYNYNRMVKNTGGRNRRRINKTITSVLMGKRNKRLSQYNDSRLSVEPSVVSAGKKMIRQFTGIIKSAIKYNEVLRKDFTVRRFAVLNDVSCHVFTPMP